MDRDAWNLDPDSVQRALEQLQPASAGMIVREAFYGTRRFDDFVRHTGLTAAVVATRLRGLEAAGLLERRAYREPGQRTRQEYRLTPRGLDLGTALVALLRWADRWLPAPDGPTVALRHRDCGSPVHVALRCGAGHALADVAEVEAVPGPGAVALGEVRARRPAPAPPSGR